MRMSSSYIIYQLISYHLISISFKFRHTILTICTSKTGGNKLAGGDQNRGESILHSPNPSGLQQQQQAAAFRGIHHVCLRQRRPSLPFPAGGRDKFCHRRGAGAAGGSSVPAAPPDGSSSTTREQQRRRREDVLRRADSRARLGMCSLSSVSAGQLLRHRRQQDGPAD